MRDFTLTAYKKLLHELLANGYSFQTLQDFIQEPKAKTAILRHDVDRLPGNSLKTALLENELGIRATYFFRTIPETFKPEIIKEIAEMGHEIGYHYENLSEISKEKRVTSKEELYELAIDDFRLNLEKLRELYPVKTICMHGSPLSKWDNRDLWKKYDYRDFGIIAEPYFDIDFSDVFYLTDTGRRWDGDRVSVRDKVKKTEVRGQNKRDEWMNRMTPVGWDDSLSEGWIHSESGINGMDGGQKSWLRFHSTWDIVEAAEKGLLPDKIMLNTHPQRWTNDPVQWTKELVWQNVKNLIKRWMIAWRQG